VHGVGTVQKDVGDAQADDFGATRAGVVQDGKQRSVPLSAPGRPVGRIEQCLHLIASQKPQNGPIEALARDGEHALRDGQGGRIAPIGARRCNTPQSSAHCVSSSQLVLLLSFFVPPDVELTIREPVLHDDRFHKTTMRDLASGFR
jgi:hypothetical protein